MYGMIVCDIDGSGQDDVPFGNTAEIIETRTVTRIHPIHFGVNYHKKPLEFEIVFGAKYHLDRYELQNIAYWLTGYQDYQWLTIEQPDLSNVQFRCLITELTPISVGWLPYAFRATVQCDCPYAYGYPFEETYHINGSTQILFANEGSVREYLRPQLTIKPASGTTKITIVNKSDNDHTVTLDKIPAGGLVIQIDNDLGIITEDTVNANLYEGFGGDFFRLVPGDNDIVVTGSCEFTISGNMLYNVGA